MLIAFGEQAGYADRSGKSGKPLLDEWVSGPSARFARVLLNMPSPLHKLTIPFAAEVRR
jgi:hypothetical protein